MKYSPFTLDLHTHSIISYDGGLSENDYTQIITSGLLDFVAITDHNTIDFAVAMKKKLGEAIIVGEEIKTKDGEIIGLFLSKTISPGLSAKETIEQIQKQKGIVYIPHPFEKSRSSISSFVFSQLHKNINIIETFNARALGRKKEENIQDLMKKYAITGASSSDAHCRLGIGTAYCIIEDKPKKENIISLLAKGITKSEYAPVFSYLCPTINKIKHTLIT